MTSFQVFLAYEGNKPTNTIDKFVGGIPRSLALPGTPTVVVRATREHDRSGVDTPEDDRFCRLDLEVEVDCAMLDSPGLLVTKTEDGQLMPDVEPHPLWGPLRWAWRETLDVSDRDGSHTYRVFLHTDSEQPELELKYEVVDTSGKPYMHENGAALILTLRASIK